MGMCGLGTKKSMYIVDINSEEGKGEISPHVIYCFEKFERGNSFSLGTSVSSMRKMGH